MPQRQERALDPEGPVALALAPGERVDRVIGATRRLGVGRGEGVPDEAADGANAARAQLRDRVESVVLVAEHRIEPFLVHPAQILGCTDLVRAGLRDVGVRPERIAGLGRAAPAQRARAASGAGEDERAVADLLESGAKLAGDRFPARWRTTSRQARPSSVSPRSTA